MSIIATLLAEDVVYVRGGWFPWFPLVPLFFLGLWVLLFALVFRRRWRRPPGGTAESVLAERYARGEITEAELRERRAVLRSLEAGTGRR